MSAPPATPPEARPADVDTPQPAARPDEIAPAQPSSETTRPPTHLSLRESDFDHSACLLTLHSLGTEYEEIAELTEPGQQDCGIARPVRVSRILPGVTLTGDPQMRCDTARQLALWTRDVVRPATGFLNGSPRLVSIEPGSTWQCRDVVGSDSNGPSEHAFGNAVDVMALTFSNGDRFEIAPRTDTGSIDEAFQRAIQGAACLYFTTVLGPGSNAAHDNHLHLDIKARNGGWRLCE